MQSFVIEKKKELLIGAAISLLLVSIGLVKGFHNTPASEPRVMIQQTATEDWSLSTGEKIAEKREIERRQKALAAIAEHEATIQTDWNSKDTPDHMMAIGNLYQYQVKDYYSAITNYRNLIGQFPDHNKVAQAYVEIANCYERIGDEAQARYIYQEMVDSLDPSLEHAKYAKLKLEEE